MYIWKIENLNEQLIAGDLPERDAFKYLLASSTLHALSIIHISVTKSINIWSELISGMISLLDIYFIYTCNGGDQGQKFLNRYIAISLVVYIRIIALLLIPSKIIIVALQSKYAEELFYASDAIELVHNSIIQVTIIFYIAFNINKVARSAHRYKNK
jgi:hypothetical protein